MRMIVHFCQQVHHGHNNGRKTVQQARRRHASKHVRTFIRAATEADSVALLPPEFDDEEPENGADGGELFFLTRLLKEPTRILLLLKTFVSIPCLCVAYP